MAHSSSERRRHNPMNIPHPKRVLAFDLHPLCFGFVLTEGPDELIDWGVRSFRHGANAVKLPMSKRLASLIDEYRPNALLVRVPRAGISRRAKMIGKLAAARRLPARTVSLDAIRKAFPHSSRNKHEIANGRSFQRYQVRHSSIRPRKRALYTRSVCVA